MSSRKTNPELVADFRSLLTEGAQWQFRQLGKEAELLEQTKPWRAELWRQFKEIEARLVPKPPSDSGKPQ